MKTVINKKLDTYLDILKSINFFTNFHTDNICIPVETKGWVYRDNLDKTKKNIKKRRKDYCPTMTTSFTDFIDVNGKTRFPCLSR